VFCTNLRTDSDFYFIQGPAEIPETILQNSCEWKRWRGEFVLERPSSETQSISVGMERWSVEHRAFAVQTIFKNNDFVLTQRIFRRHFNIQYSIPLPLRISQEQGVRKETKDNGGFATEHQGRNGSNFSPTCCNE